MKKLKRNWLAVSKLTWRIWQVLTRALESLKNFYFNELLLEKVCTVWAKHVQRSCLSWHERVMQNLKKSWLVVWKMTREIWHIFTRGLKSLSIGTLMGSFYSKYKIYELKIYEEVLCHNNEEWCKILRGIDFKTDMRNLTNFDPRTRKSQTFAL